MGKRRRPTHLTPVPASINSAFVDESEATTDQDMRRAFSDALASIRKQRGLTQTDLADRAGIAQTQISGYERGRIPDPPQMFAIENALGVAPGTLSRIVGYVPAQEQGEACTVERAVLLDQRLDDYDRRALLAMYETLSNRPR